MKKDDLNIALALSGGGVRAAVFHLGVLARLAHDGLLERVTYLSTVSGGSLVTGLIYSTASRAWPKSAFFLKECLPKAHYFLTRTNLALCYAVRVLLQPWLLLGGRANVLARTLRARWKISGTLQDYSLKPRWLINATPYESGKNWRFEKRKMGDYRLNYVADPEIDIADCLAASAGFPGLIGSLGLKTGRFTWYKYTEDGKARVPHTPETKGISLWDGGVYDNLGVEALYKQGREHEYRDEYNFLVVSDAGKGIEITEKSDPLRMVEIMMSQVGALRSRGLVNHFIRNKNSGVYLQIGNSAEHILKKSKLPQDEKEACMAAALSADEARDAAEFATTLRKLTDEEFGLLFRHGWEVADHTLIAKCPELFSHAAYKPPRLI